MIRYKSEKQPTLDGFETFFQTELDRNNRWVKLSGSIPWDELAGGYYRKMAKVAGRPAKDARLVIGAVIIKHKLCLSDEETIEQIRENPYLQYFVGLTEYRREAVFAPSLFVEIRRRMGEEMFSGFNQAIVDAVEKVKAKKKKRADNEEPGGQPATTGSDGSVEADQLPDSNRVLWQPATTESDGSVEADQLPDSDRILWQPATTESDGSVESPERQGKLILDATVAEQAIRYPTDLALLNEAREISEKIIDVLYREVGTKKKPRDYRRKARKDYLAIVKQRRPGGRVIRRGIKQQLQYLRRNLSQIDKLLVPGKSIPLSQSMLRKYWIIQHLYAQQEMMYRTKTRRCESRIVSIHQPHVRPIIRGKQNKSVEFGAKLSVSLTEEGLASVDRIGWDAFHEAADLLPQVERYKQRYGYYPEAVVADPIYGTRENRKKLKQMGIRFAGKPLGRPPKITEENKAEIKKLKQQRLDEYRQRIPIEGKFGQGKNGYGLDYIRAKTARTSEAWINSIFLVMNLIVLGKVFLLLRKITVIWRQIIAKFAQRTQNDLKYAIEPRYLSRSTAHANI